jgi:D-alanyl-D-alanine carboxypeptidase
MIAALLNLVLIFFTAFLDLPLTIIYSGDLIRPEAVQTQESISANKAAVLSTDGRFLLFSKQSEEKQPIASITKLMTALIFLDVCPDWGETYKITAADYISGGKFHLFLGDTINLRDLFLTSLVSSDNSATIALVHASGLEEEDFVLQMNQKAKELRLLNTEFTDPTGLSAGNVSTAREVALLALAAFERKEIAEALALKEYSFVTLEGREKHIESTDYLLFDDEISDFFPLGGKTGYTDKAGYCFVGLFANANGERLVASVLNSAGKNGRFQESKAIISWVLQTYFSDFKN